MTTVAILRIKFCYCYKFTAWINNAWFLWHIYHTRLQSNEGGNVTSCKSLSRTKMSETNNYISKFKEFWTRGWNKRQNKLFERKGLSINKGFALSFSVRFSRSGNIEFWNHLVWESRCLTMLRNSKSRNFKREHQEIGQLYFYLWKLRTRISCMLKDQKSRA